MKILIKYPSRSRPERFFQGLDSITNLVADKNNYVVQCTFDRDDSTMFDENIAARCMTYPNVQIKYGTSVSKIDAINRDLGEISDWDILVCMSDDMRFIAYGWDELVREGFRHNAPDLDAFLHYPDSTARNILCTMSILGRKYFERDGYIYHPSYQSLWCDNEAMEVAQKRGKYFYMGIQLFDHLHPCYSLAEWDEQYTRQQGLWGVDEANYIERKKNDFFVPLYYQVYGKQNLMQVLRSDHPAVEHLWFTGALPAVPSDEPMTMFLNILLKNGQKQAFEVTAEESHSLVIPEAINFINSLPKDETINTNTNSH